MTAAAARVAGLDVVLVLTTTTPTPDVQGNYLLDRLYGAEVAVSPAGPDPRLAGAPDEEVRVQACVERLLARGHRPYVIVVGGSSGVGALGYADGTRELVEQLRAAGLAPTRLYYAAGSRGTQAGLELGSRLFAPTYQLHGIAVSGGEPEKCVRAARIATEAARLLRQDVVLTPGELHSRQDQIGEGYGIPTPACVEAIRLLARHDGIVLDPTYTGKAMAGLIADVRAGAVAPDETIVFLHTGGVPAIFAHAEALLDA
jgi:D-cysteine desulfhydrase/L-cysteate sulfo-lyase